MDFFYQIWHKHFNETALIGAAKKNHADIVRLLLEQEGIDVNIKDILIQNH